MRLVAPLAVKKPRPRSMGSYALSVAVEFAVRAIAPAVAAVVVWAAFVVTILGADGDTAHVPHRAHAPRVPSRRLR